jgi:hypothetical protein
MKKSSAISTSFYIIVIVLLSFIQSNAQSPIIPPEIKGGKTSQIEKINLKPGEIVERITRRDGTSQNITIDLTEQLSLIVELKDEPLFIQQLHSAAGALMKMADPRIHLNQFRSDLSTLYQTAMASTKLRLPAPVIIREFSKVFSGVAIKVPRAMVDKIAALSYIKKVYLDKQVHATLEQSVHQIRADSVWSEFGGLGDSVVVGELDTGIDYADSALGGGFGPGYKVIGGYDFVNNDADPMDDNGHGTHVAGIIAANGAGLQGVAPHARLMAFKVLDNNGSGTEDEVIAGIEKAVEDHVDVANMSLGGSGDPDDAMSTAVDNAVQLGVTFCIAAGNDGSLGNGENFSSILSPGTARSAITVGAVNSSDVAAYFSSVGPNTTICSIKPEVVAPGVNILSSYLGNTTETLSGTSMATPHVTGVCALLKSLHPGWTPAQIKSAIMSSAIDIGDEVMVQGAGRVDALNAARVTAFAVPSPFSFGLDSSNFAVWSVAETLWVSNTALQSQSFNVQFDGVQAGISLSANPSSFTVAQNDSQQVIVSLSVNNSVVLFPQQGSLAYSGKVHFNGSKDTLNIPWAFVKASRVIITTDAPTLFTFASSSFVNRNFAFPPTTEFTCPAGVYDLVANYFPNIVIKEQLSVIGNASFSISSKDANNVVITDGVGNTGQALNAMPSSMNISTFVFPDSSAIVSMGEFDMPDTLEISSFSNRFTLCQGQSATDKLGNYYNAQFDPIRGLKQSITLTNNANDYYEANFLAKFPPSHSGFVDYGYGIWSSSLTFVVNVSAGLNETKTGSYSARMFFTEDKDTSFGYIQTLLGTDGEVKQTSMGTNQGDWFQTIPPRIIGDSIGFRQFAVPPLNDYVIGNGDTVTVGGGPIYTRVGAVNNAYGPSNIMFYTQFFGQLDEWRETLYSGTRYWVYNSKGNLVYVDSTSPDMQPVDVPLDAYRLVADNHAYYVNGKQGHATLTAQFDLRKPDADPPEFTSLRILNKDSRITDMFSTGEHGTITFSSLDYRGQFYQDGTYNFQYEFINTDSTQLFYRQDGTSAWNKLTVSKIAENTSNGLPFVVFGADLSSTTQYDSAGIDLKFHVVDQSGNSSDWVLEPAYGVGKFRGSIATSVNEASNSSLPTVFALQQNYPNPFNPSTTIKYDLPKETRVKLVVYDILGREVSTLVDETQKSGSYRVVWNANRFASGVYLYRLQAGNYSSTKKLLLLK